jgi:hypothetical protein
MKYAYLVDLVEDIRHANMKLRRYLKRDEMQEVAKAPRLLVGAAQREAASEDAKAEDLRELELADYLVGQYEQAVVFLGSMIQE